MPGIDGWETLRRIRGLQGHQPQVAIVSANAFERGVDNTLGIAPEDFIVKPVRHTELLDWLERKLDLTWLEASTGPVVGGIASNTEPTARSAPGVVPPQADLLALQELVRLGFYRGITNKLESIVAAHPACIDYVETMRSLARQFQFETMLTQLQNELDANHAR